MPGTAIYATSVWAEATSINSIPVKNINAFKKITAKTILNILNAYEKAAPPPKVCELINISGFFIERSFKT